MSSKKEVVPKQGVVPKPKKDIPFLRSKKTNRTPPVSIQGDESTYLCQICGVEDDVEKVRCDKCALWFHFACEQVNSDVGQQDTWLCSNCASKVKNVLSGNVNIESHQPIMIETLVDLTSEAQPKASEVSVSSENQKSAANESNRSNKSHKSELRYRWM